MDSLLDLSCIKTGPAFRFIRPALAVTMAFLVFEAAFITQLSSPRKSWQSQLTRMQTAITAMHLPAQSAPVIFIPLSDSQPDFVTELDGMMLSQDNGLATINGYSGNCPPGIDFQKGINGANSRISAYFKFNAIADDNEVNNFAKRILVWDGKDFRYFPWKELNKSFDDQRTAP